MDTLMKFNADMAMIVDTDMGMTVKIQLRIAVSRVSISMVDPSNRSRGVSISTVDSTNRGRGVSISMVDLFERGRSLGID